ncbi:FG-GAP repeat domain-containing protein [Streptomyces sp. PR69]|uniref:FG-GAP repeat domain-containing protein n=1 Tax=Streptomyces sp. PR69 TaxID=2984950 RepID=UPI0022654DE8|nr:VCBS repeat-containing protein [Streptomyces sp. PR69]
MPYARPVQRRLVAAVATVLAVTFGATALTAPAIAADDTATAATTAAAQDVIPYPRNAQIFGATATGYLTWNPDTSERTWIRASDGTSEGGWIWHVGVRSTGSGDIVATSSSSEAALTDMATGRRLLRVYLGHTGEEYAGAAGEALFTTRSDGAQGGQLTMHTKAAGATAATGLPAEAAGIAVGPGTSDHGLVLYSTGTGDAVRQHMGLIDLATGAVTETYTRAGKGDVAVSPTHVAWIEYDADARVTVVAVDRSTGTPQRMAVGRAWRRDVEVGLVGDWVTYGTRKGLTEIDANPLHALTARSLTDGTARKVLDHAISAAAAPDGAQIVRGGTVAQGEGLYRIAPAADGTPTAAIVASTGEPTKVALLSHDVPAVIDLDQNGGRAPLEWQLSRYNVRARVVLRHVATGKTITPGFTQPENGVARFDWRGELWSDGRTLSAYNGDYTWEISAEPLNGIGPALTASGTFKVVREDAPHDYNDNGSPDVLLRDSSGSLWRSDTHYYTYDGRLSEGEQKLIGGGWQIYDTIEAVGDIAGLPVGDVVARDRDGVLWEYLGYGNGAFAKRVRIGGGWQVYNQIAGGSDLDGDGRNDLLATDASGGLWFYKGTGDWRAPFAPRVKAGWGWSIYNKIEAVGNIAGAPAGDVVARDKDGVLWLYLGKGDGTFAPRTRIGGGWNVYSDLVGIGDANRDGRPDLYAYGDRGAYLYQGTGDWRAPFRPREVTNMPYTEPAHTAVV